MRVCVIYLLLYAASVIPTFAQTILSTPYAPARVQCRNNLQIRPASEVRTLFCVGGIKAKLELDSLPSCFLVVKPPFTSRAPNDHK